MKLTTISSRSIDAVHSSKAWPLRVVSLFVCLERIPELIPKFILELIPDLMYELVPELIRELIPELFPEVF